MTALLLSKGYLVRVQDRPNQKWEKESPCGKIETIHGDISRCSYGYYPHLFCFDINNFVEEYHCKRRGLRKKIT